jgi:hypothetical protein
MTLEEHEKIALYAELMAFGVAVEGGEDHPFVRAKERAPDYLGPAYEYLRRDSIDYRQRHTATV